MNYNELQKLYPDFRIPYEKEADYYLNVLLRNNPKLQVQYDDFSELCLEEIDPVRYKFKKFDEIIAYFKRYNLEMNLIDKDSPILNSKYTEQDFNNYKSDRFYISIDLKEANWQSFKFAQGLKKTNSFEEWSIKEFSLHPAISRSKSFRQFLFGNTSPKRLQSVQKAMMHELHELLSVEMKEFIVGKKSDELILEFPLNWYSQYLFPIGDSIMKLPYQFRVTFFTISEQTNFNEFVRIKNIYDWTPFNVALMERKLMGVPGNRFFIHYKTLILKEELDERDLYFENDRKLAKWLL